MAKLSCSVCAEISTLLSDSQVMGNAMSVFTDTATKGDSGPDSSQSSPKGCLEYQQGTSEMGWM